MTNPTHGGRYIIRNGKRERVGGTQSHPAGDRPRDASGKPIGGEAVRPDPPVARPTDAPAPAKDEPAPKGKKD
jgi:hypothetical protein